jgi:Ca-activated chloride channel family protein
VGSAAAEDTVRQLAEGTDGAWEMVTPCEDMAERIAAHFARMAQPRLARVDLEAGADPLWLALPQRAGFAGDTLALFAELPGDTVLPANITARLHFTDGSSSVLPVPPSEAAGLDDSLWRIAAAARLPALRTSDERQAWAVRHQLLCRETDYLLTVPRPDDAKADGLPQLQIVPHMLAAGWGGSGSVLREPCIPAFLRKAARDADLIDEGWNKCPRLFLLDINGACSGLFRRRLPRRLADLPPRHLPGELLEALKQLTKEGWDEAQVIVALLHTLQALGIAAMLPKLQQLLAAAHAKAPPALALVQRMETLLEGVTELDWPGRWFGPELAPAPAPGAVPSASAHDSTTTTQSNPAD